MQTRPARGGGEPKWGAIVGIAIVVALVVLFLLIAIL
jgi:hypothetical protein